MAELTPEEAATVAEGLISDAMDSPPLITVEDDPPRSSSWRDRLRKSEDEEAPKRRTSSASASPSASTRHVTEKWARDRVTEFANSAAAILMLLGKEFDSQVVAANADAMGEAYSKVIVRSDKLKRTIALLEKGGGYGMAIAVTLNVAIPICAYHGWLPPRIAMAAKMAGIGDMPNEEIVNDGSDSGRFGI